MFLQLHCTGPDPTGKSAELGPLQFRAGVYQFMCDSGGAVDTLASKWRDQSIAELLPSESLAIARALATTGHVIRVASNWARTTIPVTAATTSL